MRFFERLRAMGQHQSFYTFPTQTIIWRGRIEKWSAEEFYALLESNMSTFGHALMRLPLAIASFPMGNITH
jgi:hypothetical protein